MPVRHRAGSRAGAIEAFVRAWTAQYRGTPSLIALYASQALHFRVTRFDVSRALHSLQLISKTVSPVPGLSNPFSRAHFLNIVNTHLVSAAQVLWIDEKKIKDGEFTFRYNNTGYAPPGTRLHPQCVPILSSFCYTFLQNTAVCSRHRYILKFQDARSLELLVWSRQLHCWGTQHVVATLA